MIYLNENQKTKIRMFLHDYAMVGILQDVMRDSFMKKRECSDVQILAASRLAIDYLDDAFKDLRRFSVEDSISDKEFKNIAA